MTAPASPSVILYAEDSEDDAFLMKRAFARVGFPGRLVVVPHGLEATRYLSGEGRYADRVAYPFPQLILLDIKMPHLNGLDVLHWLRSRNAFDDKPVLMLTSSSQESDVRAAYAAGADSYLVKPANLDLFRELVEDLALLCALKTRPLARFPLRGAIVAP